MATRHGRRAADSRKTERLWTIREVSASLHVHPNTVRYWALTGKIRSFRQGVRKRILIPDAEVAALNKLHTAYKDGENASIEPPAPQGGEFLGDVAETLRQIQHVVPPGSRVVVFGSHARGTAKPTSDLDILIIEPELERGRLDEVFRIKSSLRTKCGLDLHVTDKQHYQRQSRIPGTLYYEVAREGVAYGRNQR